MKNHVIAAVLILVAVGVALVSWMTSTDDARNEQRHELAADAPEVPAPTEQRVADRDVAAGARVVRPDTMPDPATIEAAKAARIAQLESRVVSEPVSTQWAAENTRRIRSFLDADRLREAQLPAVDHAGVDCRTTICRIELRTQDSLAAGELTQGILQTISEQMPTAQIFESQGADGTTLLIFSTASATRQGVAFRPKR